jgi:hypothetical protein
MKFLVRLKTLRQGRQKILSQDGDEASINAV